ncbi:MAG: radical SAM protein [Desulfobaccales bacterium]
MTKKMELLGRGLRIVRQSPHILPTVARMEFRHRYGIAWDQRRATGYSAPPTNLAICLTLRCNLKCSMCRQIRGGQDVPENRSWFFGKGEMELSAWISLLDQVKGFHPWLYVTGGEPLLSPFFKEFVEAARRRHLVVQLQTNGTRLAQVAEFLVEQGVVAVTISLDGPPEVHDAIRGVKGTFKRVAEGVQALMEAREKHRSPTPVLSFNCTISKDNVAWLADMVPLAISLKADVLQFQHTMFNSPEKVERHNAFFSPARVEGLGLEMAFPSICDGEYYQSAITTEDIPVLKASLAKARELARDRLQLVFMPNLPAEVMGPYYLDLDHPFLPGCDFFWKTLRVSPDGTISPCLNFKVGNLKELTFAAIWNGPKMRKLRQLFKQRLFPGCLRCCQRHYTKGSRAF